MGDWNLLLTSSCHQNLNTREIICCIIHLVLKCGFSHIVDLFVHSFSISAGYWRDSGGWNRPKYPCLVELTSQWWKRHSWTYGIYFSLSAVEKKKHMTEMGSAGLFSVLMGPEWLSSHSALTLIFLNVSHSFFFSLTQWFLNFYDDYDSRDNLLSAVSKIAVITIWLVSHSE